MRILTFLAILSVVNCQDGFYRDKFTKSLRNFTGILYQQIEDKSNDANFMFSPLSIYQAMGMVLAGAKENTELQLRKAMNLDADVYSSSRIHNLMGKSYFHNVLNSQEQVFRMANGMFIQNDFEIRQDYVDVLIEKYRADVQNINFADEKASRRAVNRWVSQNTMRKIKNLVKKGELSPFTELVLANALYFQAQWQVKFQTNPKQISFHVQNNKHVKTTFMMRRGKFLTYFEIATGTSFIAIPYQSKESTTTYMILAWPKDNDWETFNGGLNKVLSLFDLNHFKSEEIILNIPKFTMTSSHNVKDILLYMGVSDLFDENKCNLTGISSQDLYVSNFDHKAHLAVNEKGTRASAATKVVFAGRSLDRTKVVTLDRPFFFGIYNEKSLSFTFVGKLHNPTKSSV